jgi:hypothetical protein
MQCTTTTPSPNEGATWVAGVNHHRLQEFLGYIPPAEVETSAVTARVWVGVIEKQSSRHGGRRVFDSAFGRPFSLECARWNPTARAHGPCSDGLSGFRCCFTRRCCSLATRPPGQAPVPERGRTVPRWPRRPVSWRPSSGLLRLWRRFRRPMTGKQRHPARLGGAPRRWRKHQRNRR